MDMSSQEVTKLDMLISQLQNQGKSSFHGCAKGITTRLPLHQYASIEALSRHTGMSKNKVICQLLEVALEMGILALDRPNRRSFNKHQSEVFGELAAEGYGENVSDL